MAKFLFVLSALLALQVCIAAASNAGLHPIDTKFEQDKRIEGAGPTLDGTRARISEDTKNSDGISSQAQRQKRFYNYFNFGFTPYGPFNPTFVKRDNSQDTGDYGTEDPLSQIFKRVQYILNFTRQQAFSPPPAPQIPVPSYIPVFYIPSVGCGCTYNNNQRPNNDEEPNNEAPSAPYTTTTAIPTINNASPLVPPNDNAQVTPSPNDDSNKTSPGLFSRFPEMDKEYNYDDKDDGVRPISFEPIKPDKPLSIPPPPVEHGSSQASSNAGSSNGVKQDAPTTTTGSPFIHRVPAQPDLPTNAIPTLCDGATLTCCHRPEVTYECFATQGCPDPTPSDNPCDANAILNVIRKFQYYYANRKASNTLL